jgi:hypothetical protein
MSIRSPYEMEQLKKFVERYGVRDIKVEPAQYYKVNPLDTYAFSANDFAQFETHYVNMYKMSIPEDKLDRIANIVTEFDDLMQDPETAKLLMEARFINRLKRGRY